MASRDRKREERRKRKQRSGMTKAEREARRAEREAATEALNQAAREELEPLEEGERPTVVTVAALLSGALAITVVVAYALGTEVTSIDDLGNETGSAEASIVSIIPSVAILSVMAYGLWRARYWAVLGFQTLMVLLILVATLSLLAATSGAQVVRYGGLLVIASVFFYRMVKAMARIQMPERKARN